MRKTEEFWIEFDAAQEDEGGSSRILSTAYDLFDSLKSAVIVVFLLFTVVFRAVGVEGDSMVPTLDSGDWVAVTGMMLNCVERGDIVVVTQPWERNVPIIKRVIGVGGDEIMIDFSVGTITVNGEVLDESYISERTKLKYDVEFPVTVPQGKLFLMGDNRNISLDSRSSAIGFVDESYVLGKVIVRLYPASHWDIYDNREEE